MHFGTLAGQPLFSGVQKSRPKGDAAPFVYKDTTYWATGGDMSRIMTAETIYYDEKSMSRGWGQEYDDSWLIKIYRRLAAKAEKEKSSE
jgi:hypothetical protein